MVPGAFILNHEQLAPQIEAERRHFQLNRDNAILVPEPSALAFATADLFWTWRMVEITWPQWRNHINNMLYPDDSPEGKMQRMRNQDDEFSTLFQYLDWNNGINNNLKQLIDETFPSYSAWMNDHVMPPSAMFRGPPTASILTRTDLMPDQTMSLARRVKNSSITGPDAASLPSSQFMGDNSRGTSSPSTSLLWPRSCTCGSL